jgi:NAD(P)-dependent dehydrogenase (short-subunit alcohol dehydrogenase family)
VTAGRQRIAVVSGANRGIGLEVARRLADLGHGVVLGSRRLAAGQRAAAQIGGSVRALQLDVTDPESVGRFAATVVAEHGRLHVLVNNAGVPGADAGPLAADLNDVRQTIETNLFGAWRLTQALAPALRAAGGARIVNVSSGMGQLSEMRPDSAGYRLSKTALNALTVMLARDLAPDGVLVNAACPGWVRTRMGLGAWRSVQEGADTPVWLATLPADGPSGRLFRDRRQIAW